jgi:hypothetical protein
MAKQSSERSAWSGTPLHTGPPSSSNPNRIAGAVRVIARNRTVIGTLVQPTVPEVAMKLLHTAAVLALIASPALAQNTVNPPNNLPRAQNSGAGVPGQAGNKNGPAAGPYGQSAGSDQTNQATRLQDTSGIPGKPGSKSGPAVMPPSRSASRAPSP